MIVPYFVHGMIEMWFGMMCLFMQNAWNYGIVIEREPGRTQIAMTTAIGDFVVVDLPVEHVPKDCVVTVHYSIINPTNISLVYDGVNSDVYYGEDMYPQHLLRIKKGLYKMMIAYPYVLYYYPYRLRISA